MNLDALCNAIFQIVSWGRTDASVVMFGQVGEYSYRDIRHVWVDIKSGPAITTDGIYCSVSLRSGSMGTFRDQIIRPND
jgi:hypothetical protein